MRRPLVAFVCVTLVALILLGVGAGSFPLIDPDEARFARTSVEMARSGDLVVPSFEGRPRLVKPPFLHWVHAALFEAFGPSELAARLPAIAATLGSILITAWIALRRFGPEGAVWAAAVVASSPLVIVLGRVGTLDALLALHVLAIVALDIAEPSEVGSERAWVAGALAGVAFLIKGPVGVILPVLLILAGRTAAGRDPLPRLGAFAKTAVAAVAVVAPWGLVFLERVGIETVVATVRHETLERYFAGTSHVAPPWFYAAVMIVGFVPWVVPLVTGMGRAIAHRSEPTARTAWYASAALLAGLLFFSLGQGKLPSYVLPLAPFVAVLVTWELGQHIGAPAARRRAAVAHACWLGVVGLGLLVVPELGIPPSAAQAAHIGSVVFLLACGVALSGVLRHRPRWGFGAAAAASTGLLLAVVLLYGPELSTTRSAAGLVEREPGLRRDDVVVVGMQLPSFAFYADRVPERVGLDAFAARLDADDRPWFVFDRRDFEGLEEGVRERLEVVERSGKYMACREFAPVPASGRPAVRTLDGRAPPG